MTVLHTVACHRSFLGGSSFDRVGMPASWFSFDVVSATRAALPLLRRPRLPVDPPGRISKFRAAC